MGETPRKREESVFENPLKGFDRDTVPIETRRDPLTGHTTIIVPPRGLDSPLQKEYDPDVEYRAFLDGQSGGFCPFCGENAIKSTPRFVNGEERYIRGNSVLFPNLHPYAECSPVNVINIHQHSPRLDEIKSEDIANSLKNFQDLTVFLTESGIEMYIHIGMNYLPPAGSSIVHPHMQAMITDEPRGMFRDVLAGAERHYTTTGRSYWTEILGGERLIAVFNDWALVTPYAPLGFNEVDIVHLGTEAYQDIDEESIDELAELITRVLKFYAGRGKNSFNMGLYGLTSRHEHHSTHVRLITRMPLYPYYRSDETFIEKMFFTHVIDTPPEETARQLREFLGV